MYKRLLPLFIISSVIVIVAAVHLRTSGQSTILPYRDILFAPAPAYRNAPFVGDPQFWADLKHWPIGCTPGDTTIYHSKYFNVDGCIRRIVGQRTAQHRIWLFGSSTLYNLESPDNWTIASLLQAQVKAWRVEQRTANAASALIQVDLMKQQPIARGDIVVLYGAWADAFEAARGNLVERVRDYGIALALARSWCSERGARLIVVLQPLVWSQPLTPDEQALLDAQFEATNDVAGRIMPAIEALRAAEPSTLDLTHILDKARADGPVYFEGWHTNWRANAIIARAIAAALWTEF